ncbi:delta-sarcoglycan-like [Ornithodoros turicata]|uniref:delta-sarcoglycan-like n=1 Tax=Ornithodoros turicata TaxID=34597 RepID=UPI003138E9B5
MATTMVTTNGDVTVHQADVITEEEEHFTGWKKRCVYILVGTSTILATINLSLALWIVRVLDLTSDGPGTLALSARGIRARGNGELWDILQTQKIHRDGKREGLRFESARDIKLQSADGRSRYYNTLALGSGVLESRGSHFLVRNSVDGVLFRSDPSEVLVAADNLRISTKAGFQLDGSLHAEVVRGSPTKAFRVESPMKRISIHGEEEVAMLARTGDGLVKSLQDIKLHGRKGKIEVDSHRLEFKNLEVADASFPADDVRVYQVCACDNGKIFLTPAARLCRAVEQLCRDSTATGHGVKVQRN